MIDVIDRQLIMLLQQGLPLVSRPYAVIGGKLKLNEEEVINRVSLIEKTRRD